jgi:hypothetical protein
LRGFHKVCRKYAGLEGTIRRFGEFALGGYVTLRGFSTAHEKFAGSGGAVCAFGWFGLDGCIF